jgi:hypothetical protein
MCKPHKTIILWAIILMAFFAKSQTLVNKIGVSVTENFNSLTSSNTITPWVQNSTLQNWYAYEMDPYFKAIDFSADSGTGTGGRLYSYGRAQRSDRALGSLCSSGNDSIVFAWRLKNTTGVKVDSIKISFTGEQWRRTSGTVANKLLFFYKKGSYFSKIDSASIRNLTGNGFTYFQNLDFLSPQTGSITSFLNGNDAANSKFLSQTIAVTIADGEEIILLWLDDDEAGNDHGLAIDNISVTFLINPHMAPLTSISDIKQIDSIGINLSLNKRVEIRGTALGINFDTAGLKFVVHDSTGGIVALSPQKSFGYSVNERDSLHITGEVIQEEGFSMLLIDTIIPNGIAKINLTNPVIIKLPAEKHECELVKIPKLQLAQTITVWPRDGFVNFVNGTDTVLVFIDKETDIDSLDIPVANSYSITGFVFQSSKSEKLDDGYYLVPRNLKDIQYKLPPSISFTKSNLIVSEKDTLFIELKISNPDSNITSVIIEKAGGTSANGKDYSYDFPVTITFPPLSDSNQSLKIPLTNDVFDEPSKTIDLVIRNISNGGKILKDSILSITILDNDNPLYSIGFAAKIDMFGVPDSNNRKVQVQGIVYGVNYRPSGLQFTIRDSTGGIGVFHPTGNFGYELSEGDEILVSGTISHFRGLTQLIDIDTILKIRSNLVLNSPILVAKLDEFSESNLVKIEGLRWAQAKPTKWVANSTYKFTNGKDTFKVRIDGDINLAETITPTYNILDITGIGGQLSTFSSSPFLDGYLLYPRYSSDIEKFITETSSIKNLTNFVSVFPNPSNGNFEIMSQKAFTSIRIVSTTGETIYDSKIPGLLQKSLNLNLPSGIYLLKIGFENNFVYKRIMIK